MLKKTIGIIFLGLSLIFAYQMNNIGSANETKTYAVEFVRGTSPGTGYAETIDIVVEFLENNEQYIVVLEGHTGTRGPAITNQELAMQRSERVARDLYFQGVDENRVHVFSSGEEQPLEQQEDEDSGAYQSRLNRVEIYLINKNLLPESVI